MADPVPGSYGCVPVAGDVGKGIAVGQMLFRRLARDAYPDSVAFRYQHAFVYVDDGMIVEAEPGGAVRRPLHYDNVLWSKVPLSNAQRFVICNAAASLVGRPYSFLDYAAIAMHGFGLNFPGLQGYIGATGHVICSQLVALCYRKVGIYLGPKGEWDGYVLPADLAELALKG